MGTVFVPKLRIIPLKFSCSYIRKVPEILNWIVSSFLHLKPLYLYDITELWLLCQPKHIYIQSTTSSNTVLMLCYRNEQHKEIFEIEISFSTSFESLKFWNLNSKNLPHLNYSTWFLYFTFAYYNQFTASDTSKYNLFLEQFSHCSYYLLKLGI